jgi:phosphoenolpyruvate carboxylase
MAKKAGTKTLSTRGPYKKAEERRDKQEEVILHWLSRGYTESGAAAKADISWSQYHKWKRESEPFRALVAQAIDVGTETLEDVATSRARRKSDVLLMFILKKRNPAFRDKQEVNVTPVTILARRFAK